MKRRICLLMLLGTMISMAGCGAAGDKEPDIQVKEGTPVYEDNAHIERGAYSMPAKADYLYPDAVNGARDESRVGWESNINEQEFRDYKDAGFTFMLTEYNADWEMNQDFSESGLYPAMELAEKVGIPMIIHTSPLERFTSTDDFRISDENKQYLQKLVSTLSTYQMFRGFSLRDEPKAEFAPTFKAYKEYLLSLKPDAMFFGSFHPIYGSAHVSFSSNNQNAAEEYSKYIDTYLENMDSFTYDYYPLRVDGSRKVNFIMESFYENLELVATKAKDHGNAKIGLTIQSSSYGQPGMQDSSSHARTISTKEDIGFQMYSALAYGVKEFGYFTYWLHWGTTDPTAETFYDAMVMPPEVNGGAGVKTDAYYAVQAMNQELKKFDHVMLNYNWQGTMAVAPEGKTKSMVLSKIADYKNERVKDVAVSEETIIGCLKDGEGYDGYMIVNATEPSEGKTDTVTISFYKATKAIAYVHGEEQTITLEDGSYTFEIGAGEGVFVIPIV